MTKARIDLRSLLTLLLVSCAAAACHDAHSQLVGSESHFLELCERDAECGELRCLSGVCTHACTNASECSALSGDAECMAKSSSAPWSAPARSCGLACDRDDACSTFDADLTCQHGRCAAPLNIEPPPQPRVDAGAPGQAGAVAPSASIDDPAEPTRAVTESGPQNAVVVGGSGQCGQQTPFDGDDACLLPPSPDEGIQIHIGPKSYDDAAELMTWVIEPGVEITKCVTFQMPDEEFAFAEWEISGRPDIHHSAHLLDMSDGRYDACLQDGATLAVSPAAPNQLIAAQARVARAPAAPENATIARRIPAGAPAGTWIHAVNFTDKPTLIELWLNLYKPREQPTQYDVPVSLGPSTDLTVDQGVTELKHFECPITAASRLLSLSALTLPSTHGVDVWLEHPDGERIALLHRPDPAPERETGPTTFRFDSVTTNPPINTNTTTTEGGFSGQVELEPGDVLGWDCLLSGDGSSPFNLCNLGGSATVPIDCELSAATAGAMQSLL